MQTGLIHFGVVKVGMVVIDFVMAYLSLLREKKTLRLRDLTLTVNTKYNLSSVLKTLEFSRVRSMSDIFDVFNSRDEIFLVFTPKKVNFLFILYLL